MACCSVAGLRALPYLWVFYIASISCITLTHTCTGAAGGTFAAGACMTARFRDKDDYVNAAVGGLLAGAVFGLKCKAI